MNRTELTLCGVPSLRSNLVCSNGVVPRLPHHNERSGVSRSENQKGQTLLYTLSFGTTEQRTTQRDMKTHKVQQCKIIRQNQLAT